MGTFSYELFLVFKKGGCHVIIFFCKRVINFNKSQLKSELRNYSRIFFKTRPMLENHHNWPVTTI